MRFLNHHYAEKSNVIRSHLSVKAVTSIFPFIDSIITSDGLIRRSISQPLTDLSIISMICYKERIAGRFDLWYDTLIAIAGFKLGIHAYMYMSCSNKIKSDRIMSYYVLYLVVTDSYSFFGFFGVV